MIKIPPWIIILCKALCIPVLSMYAVNKFNIFEFITIIPDDQKFNFGLTAYLTIIEFFLSQIQTQIDKRRASISCVFYTKPEEKNIANTPRIVCGEESCNVAYIYCEVTLAGNAKVLRNASLRMSLPQWVQSQNNKKEPMVHYESNALTWKFDALVPETGNETIITSHIVRIPFIDTQDAGFSRVELKPNLLGLYNKLNIRFSGNPFELLNKER